MIPRLKQLTKQPDALQTAMNEARGVLDGRRQLRIILSRLQDTAPLEAALSTAQQAAADAAERGNPIPTAPVVHARAELDAAQAAAERVKTKLRAGGEELRQASNRLRAARQEWMRAALDDFHGELRKIGEQALEVLKSGFGIAQVGGRELSGLEHFCVPGADCTRNGLGQSGFVSGDLCPLPRRPSGSVDTSMWRTNDRARAMVEQYPGLSELAAELARELAAVERAEREHALANRASEPASIHRVA